MGICDECIIKDGCKFANSGLIMKHCKNFIGEAPREIKTNFQRISASPEALAEFMEKHASCGHDCPITDKRVCEYKYENCKEAWVKWLKQESE